VVRPAHDETSYFQGLCLFMHPLDHIPGVVAIVGMPLHSFLMIMVGWLVMRPPILQLWKKIIKLLVNIIIIIIIIPILYIEGGSSLLKSRDGGRSLTYQYKNIYP